MQIEEVKPLPEPVAPIHSEIEIDVTPPARAEPKKTLYVRIDASNFEYLRERAHAANLSLAVFIDRVTQGLRRAKTPAQGE